MARARAYIEPMPVSVSGNNGHGALYRVTCVLWNGFALTRDETLEILREFSSRCLPPWEEHHLTHKVDEAQKKQHRDPRGYLLHARPPVGKLTPIAPGSAESVTHKIVPKPLPASPKGLAVAPQPAASGEGMAVICADLAPLVSVPGCRVGRPPEIMVDDDTWRAIEAAGFAQEPQIQNALFLFGPGCRVILGGNLTPG